MERVEPFRTMPGRDRASMAACHSAAAFSIRAKSNRSRNEMSLGQELAPHLPFLRRYARALTGSQHHGDAFVRATLETIVAAPEDFPQDVDPRLGLYKIFHAIWSSAHIEDNPDVTA